MSALRPTEANLSSRRDSESALGLFFASLGTVNAMLGGTAGVIIAILLLKFDPNVMISGFWLLVVAPILLSCIIALINALLRATEIRPSTIVRQVDPPESPYGNCKCLLVVSWSSVSALPIGSRVSIAVAEKFKERLIGDGTIPRIQLNGGYVITIDSLYDGNEDYVKDSLLNTKAAETVLPFLRIGPLISFQDTLALPATPTTPKLPNKSTSTPPNNP